MLSRLIFRPSNLRLLTLTTIPSSSNLFSHSPTSSNLHRPITNPTSLLNLSRPFSKDNRSGSSNGKDKDPSVSQSWTLSPDPDESSESVFGSEEADLSGIANEDNDTISTVGSQYEVKEGGDIFEDIDREFRSGKGGGDEWETAEGYVPWSFGDQEKDGDGNEGEHVFDIGGEGGGGIEGLSVVEGDELEASEDDKRFEEEEQVLSATLKGAIFFFKVLEFIIVMSKKIRLMLVGKKQWSVILVILINFFSFCLFLVFCCGFSFFLFATPFGNTFPGV